ncbi:MAG: aspartate-semialdehyde dehydrogenase [Phycisphaerales bacterium]|nr:MAG: aspartate-semialdehyde dehydrogenase [Phycisphaerales bacterium]
MVSTFMFKSLAVVGATGAVGREFARLLEHHLVGVERIRLLASARSAGTSLPVRGTAITVECLTHDSLTGADLAFFSAGRDVSREFAPPAARAGTIVIDNSSAFRMEPDVPLVVPEVNPQDLDHHHGLIANPNCSTILLAMVLGPLHLAHPIRRVVVSTYQAASGAGHSAMQELQHQTGAVLAGRRFQPEVFPHPCALNVFSHESTIDESGYNEEERKIMAETRKILGHPNLAISATSVRVPVLRAHSESVNITFGEPVTEDEVREILRGSPGLRVVDDRPANHFPMPSEASGIDEVLVGRIRQDLSQAEGRGIELFLSGDQLRKGAALNAIQIAERLQPS